MAIENGKLTNVAFYYTRIQSPVNKYESTDQEWKTTVVVDKTQATKFSKRYPKVKYKTVPNDDFREQYKTEVPFPEQPLQYVFNFKRNCVNAQGVPVPEDKKPKVLIKDAAGDIFDATNEYLVGNGSMGDIFYYSLDTKFGEYTYLQNILITKLVHFEQEGSGDFIDTTKVKSVSEGGAKLDGVIVKSDGEELEEVPEPSVTTKQTPTEDDGPVTVKNDKLPF